jgi:hypothetical protein
MSGVGPQPGYGTVNEQHGILWQAARKGSLFRGGNQAVVVTAMTAGLPTAYTGGLMLYNPLASTRNLSIREAAFATTVLQGAAGVLGLATARSASALGGTLTVVPNANALVGSSATSQGILYSSASVTLPVAPVQVAILDVLLTGALTTSTVGGLNITTIAGGIELQPGGYCCFVCSAAVTASSFMGTFTWEETPIGQ